MIWVTNGIVLAVAALGTLLWWIAGWHLAGLLWFAACSIGLIAFHSYFAQALQTWLANPGEKEMPSGPGIWADIYYRVTSMVRGAQTETDELATEIDDIRAAVNQLPNSLVVLDDQQFVRWCNRSAVELHGIFETNRPIQQFIREPQFNRYLEQGNFDRPLRLELNDRPGRTFELRIHVTGENSLLVVTEVTEQARVDALRNDFIANVSHEIRTPVTVINGFAETMLDLPLEPDKQREYLENISRHSATMQSLIEDLLVLSSLESEIDETIDEQIELDELFAGLAAEARDISAGKHDIATNAPDGVIIHGTRKEIESAVRNLLTNAIRYTPDGGQITLEWQEHESEGWVSVRDNGIGIAPEHLPRLSERFYRVDRGRSRETGGTGLGLAIVKRIANRHDATLHIDSHPGEGSTFSLIFPARRIERTPEARSASQ